MEDLDADIMVRPDLMQFGIKGDKVEVELTKVRRPKKYEGKILNILDRQQTQFIGKLDVLDDFAFFISDNQKLPFDIFIPLSKLMGAMHNDHVRVEITRSDKKEKSRR